MSTDDDDLVWGIPAIAKELGLSIGRVRYLIRTKRLPFVKLGHKTILASRKKLQAAKRTQFIEYAESETIPNRPTERGHRRQ